MQQQGEREGGTSGVCKPVSYLRGELTHPVFLSCTQVCHVSFQILALSWSQVVKQDLFLTKGLAKGSTCCPHQKGILGPLTKPFGKGFSDHPLGYSGQRMLIFHCPQEAPLWEAPAAYIRKDVNNHGPCCLYQRELT